MKLAHHTKDKEAAPTSQKVVSLPRGGIVVNTKIGPVQIGMPPETIKDSMALGIQVPTFFVFPRELFDRATGISMAEAEFPAYFNFFILKKRIKFIATPEQELRLRCVFRETLLGPEKIDLRKEVSRTFPEDRLPDLERESRYIRTFNEIDELFIFIHFDSVTHMADLGDGVQIIDYGDEYAIVEDGVTTARTPTTVTMPPSNLGRRLNVSKTFTPPLFGVTVLGSSHGFDPEKKTTGFVLWVNRRGIVVDPPLHSAAMLHTSGVPSRLVDTVVLTHCHADHDSGTFQKILDEHQVTVITTPTIMGSFLRKYSALSGLPETVMRRLFNFRPILLGESLMVHGGEFQFWYTIHTIPTVGFEAYYSGKSVYYSADTCYEPARIRDMGKRG